MTKIDTNELLKEYRRLRNYGEIAKYAANLAKDEAYWNDIQGLLDAVKKEFGLDNLVTYREEADAAPLHIVGEVGKIIPDNALDQMRVALRLPPVTGGALLPDAHHGYSLPIGGVAVMDKAVSPAFVGKDISCMMMLSIMAITPGGFMEHRDAIAKDLVAETSFGLGAHFEPGRRDHEVMDLQQWNYIKTAAALKDLAASQLGSSGGGNHFADLVIGKVLHPSDWLRDYQVGDEFVALMTHSGSRGPGNKLADYYTKLAEDVTNYRAGGIPKGYGWLETDSSEGMEYLEVMRLMGSYALANHELIHKHFSKSSGIELLQTFWNRHNYAWVTANGVIHRKGATPADDGLPGIIPGSSGSLSYFVEGLGYEDTYSSSSHGAGRPFSRTEAKRQHDAVGFKEFMQQEDILYFGVASDETVHAYKDIESVMQLQDGLLLRRIASLRPKVVIMGGESKKRGRKK